MWLLVVPILWTLLSGCFHWLLISLSESKVLCSGPELCFIGESLVESLVWRGGRIPFVVASIISHCVVSFLVQIFQRICCLDCNKMAETRKPNKLYATHPKGYGKGSRACRVTGREGGMGLIRKYGINMKRQVFRERAIEMGWNKYN